MFKGTLDFYYRRGVLVVRSWPRKPSRPRAPAVQAAGQDWKDTSRAISALPLELRDQWTELMRDSVMTWRDAATSAAYGNAVFIEPPRPPGSNIPLSEHAMIIDLLANLNAGTTTININSGSYIFRTGWTFWVPFSSVPFTHFRVTGYGQSNQAGQTISLAVGADSAPATPAHSPGPDVTVPNAINHFDSGWLSIDNIPSGDERWILFPKGSNNTVDLAAERLYVEFTIL